MNLSGQGGSELMCVCVVCMNIMIMSIVQLHCLISSKYELKIWL